MNTSPLSSVVQYDSVMVNLPSAVNLPSGTSVTVRVQAVNTAGISTSNTVVLQGLYVKHDCMYTHCISLPYHCKLLYPFV